MSGPHPVEDASTTSGLPVSVGLGPTLDLAGVGRRAKALTPRSLAVIGLCLVVAAAMVPIAWALVALIGLVTNLVFHGRFDLTLAAPAGHRLGLAVLVVPAAGALLVGLMARFGSKAIRGHGIPEAMEQILTNKSRIPARMTFLKPLSAALAIGTGGPFGAEGPIIATGGALGSLIGQWVHVTADERKTILAAGAAAGMTAIFGTPLAAILLAIELLLFEFRPRSFIPVALAVLVAIGLRPLAFGTAPLFHLAAMPPVPGAALGAYAVEGAAMGLLAVGLSRSIYAIEDLFDLLPLHWMWWPAVGALAVGAMGALDPRTLGVGYENIDAMLGGNFTGTALALFCLMKFVSWAVALGSGTSGGTLAPIFTLGGGCGVLAGQALAAVWPAAGTDLRLAALVGMAATFAGASRALFASVAFALEITGQFNALLPLLAACTLAYAVSALVMPTTIMTEKLVRRGHHVPTEYGPLAH